MTVPPEPPGEAKSREPIRQSVFAAKIERILDRARGTRSLWLRLPTGQKLDFLPGQFISCELPVGEKPILRPYSIASSSDDGNLIEICLDLVPGGPGSRTLFSLPIGSALRFTGPWGFFALDRPPDAECVFLAEGTGVVPLRLMIRRALDLPSESRLVLLYGERDEQRILYREDLESWARGQPRFIFLPLLREPSDRWQGLRGDLFAEVEQRYVKADSGRSRNFFICGVGDIVIRLRTLLRSAGYDRRAIQYEKW